MPPDPEDNDLSYFTEQAQKAHPKGVFATHSEIVGESPPEKPFDAEQSARDSLADLGSLY